MSLATIIADNLAQVRERIAAAAERAGRRPDSVRLVAVTKYVSLEAVRAVVAAGCLDLGESRPQQLWQRAAELTDRPVRWHLIGHLQRNKAARTLPLTALVHSLDSVRLAEAIDQEAAAAALPQPVPALIEVNISGEAAKHGFAPQELPEALPRLAALSHVEVRGLMCMAGLESGAEAARREFAGLRALRDRLLGDPVISEQGARLVLDELSMGMSGDFEVAIEEGATIVRVGSALFEGVE